MSVYYDMSNEEYHSKKEYFSSSQLKVAYHDIEKFKLYCLDGKSDNKRSKALDLGTAVHCALLEEDKFSSKYYMIDTSSLNLRTKKDRESVEKIKLENENKTSLSKQEFEIISGIKKSVSEYPMAQALLNVGVPEVSIFSESWIIPQRIRPDRIDTVNHIIIDLKTTAKGVSLDQFFKNALALDYDLSAYNYIDVANRHYFVDNYRFFWVVVSTEKPYSVAVYEAGPMTLEKGKDKYETAITKIAKAKNSNNFKIQTTKQNSDEYFSRFDFKKEIEIDF